MKKSLACLLFLAAAAYGAAPPADLSPTDHKFEITFPVAKSCRISLELPVGGEKLISVEEFAKHKKMIGFHYTIKKFVVDGLVIKEIHFVLIVPEEKKPEKQFDAAAIQP